MKERPFQRRVTSLLRDNAALKAPLFHEFPRLGGERSSPACRTLLLPLCAVKLLWVLTLAANQRCAMLRTHP